MPMPLGHMSSGSRAPYASESNAALASAGRAPSRAELLLMLASVFAIHIFAVCRVTNFWELAIARTDDMDFVTVATIILNWHFPGGPPPANFWGFPYAIAGFAKIFSVPELMAAVLISVLGSLAVCTLVHRLYGGWVAAAFIFISFDWIRVSIEGGSEPLFMCCLYASFLAARSDRWNLAALLGSLSTTVRPLGIFALFGFAGVLAMRRDYRRLVVITLIGLGLGVLYVVPLWVLLGSPFNNFAVYRGDWGPHGWPLTYPFGALISSFRLELHSSTRWYTLVYSAAWPILALVGVTAMWLPRNRHLFWTKYQPEAVFVTTYTFFFLSYNYIEIFWFFPRFVVPVLPLLVFSARDWIPRDRRVLWGATVLSALLSAAVLVHFKNVFGFGLP
jgi:hypothetical protein